jgi:hypothetical protein
MSILTAPERIAEMLADCHPSIRARYWLTQEAIDQIERPAWLVFVDGASYSQDNNGEDLVDQSYSIAYIGQIFTSAGNVFTSEYEILARQVANNAIAYLRKYNKLKMANLRGLQPAALPNLNSILYSKVDNRSGITLYTRDGTGDNAFWGFTIDLTVTHQFVFDEEIYPY